MHTNNDSPFLIYFADFLFREVGRSRPRFNSLFFIQKEELLLNIS